MASVSATAWLSLKRNALGRVLRRCERPFPPAAPPAPPDGPCPCLLEDPPVIAAIELERWSSSTPPPAPPLAAPAEVASGNLARDGSRRRSSRRSFSPTPPPRSNSGLRTTSLVEKLGGSWTQGMSVRKASWAARLALVLAVVCWLEDLRARKPPPPAPRPGPPPPPMPEAPGPVATAAPCAAA